MRSRKINFSHLLIFFLLSFLFFFLDVSMTNEQDVWPVKRAQHGSRAHLIICAQGVRHLLAQC
jgi:hypothetical protein